MLRIDRWSIGRAEGFDRTTGPKKGTPGSAVRRIASDDSSGATWIKGQRGGLVFSMYIYFLPDSSGVGIWRKRRGKKRFEMKKL